MLTVAIEDNGEKRVTDYTYELLWRELKDIPGADLQVTNDWAGALKATTNKYICFVEPDCLVNSGYFSSQLGLLKKDPYFRKLAMLSSTTCVEHWANRFYGYSIKDNRVEPNRVKRSGAVNPVQIGYVPGSIIRVSMLREVVADTTLDMADLVGLSVDLSLAFWRQGDGNRVHLNPNAAYVTTETYVNDLSKLKVNVADLVEKFERESI